jgi:hypothetical protein
MSFYTTEHVGKYLYPKWASNCIRKYVSVAKETLLAVQRRLGRGAARDPCDWRRLHP